MTPLFLGAHVSSQGGVAHAPERGRAIGANAIQVFTKSPNQWREPRPDRAAPRAFREALALHGIGAVVSHDSYLINLASPDAAMRARSEAAFAEELRRCEAFGIPWVVSHPGNFLGERSGGIRRNAESYARCLAAVPGRVGVAIETTSGSGTALGATFEELRALTDAHLWFAYWIGVYLVLGKKSVVSDVYVGGVIDGPLSNWLSRRLKDVRLGIG